jgi:hypothetical protein
LVDDDFSNMQEYMATSMTKMVKPGPVNPSIQTMILICCQVFEPESYSSRITKQKKNNSQDIMMHNIFR